MERDNLNWTRGTPAAHRTRGALADLSRQLAGVTVTLLSTPNSNIQLPSSMMSPAPSPDEMIITLRGRKKAPPITWSPLSQTGVQKFSQYEITPPKDSTPNRVLLGLRSSPRKRLQLTETKETATNTSPEKSKKNLPANKRQRLDGEEGSVPLEVAIKGLSHSQLISLIQKMTSTHPTVKQDLESSLPEPDLQPMMEELMYLKKNIFKSLPNSRLSSKTDSAAFNKASVHLSAFKKAILEHEKRLVESEQWNSVVQYTLMAWGYVKATPVWDNVQHNVIRKHCFKTLATSCLRAMKCENRDADWRRDMKQRFERLRVDSEEIEGCITFLSLNLDQSLD